MKVFLAALVIVALAVFGLCFNIIFRKNGEFPQYEVGSNRKMKEMGIKCMNEEEQERKSNKIKLDCNGSCGNCGETECR